MLNISVVETRSNDGAPVFTKSAFTNTGQRLEERSAIIGSNNPVKTPGQGALIEKPEVSVIVSPNPFSEKLTYNYLLSDQMTVSIELYDSSGKNSGWLAKDQIQTVGLHTGEFSALTYGLTPGVYFIRFTFDKQVVIRKIVKI